MRDITRTHGLSAPGAVSAALWLQAWLDGQAGSDDLLSMLAWVAPDTPVGLQEPDATHPAESLLQRIRARQPVQAWPVLPRPGRTLGWPPTVPGDPSPSVLLVAGPAQWHTPEARLLARAGSSGWILDDLRDPASSAPAGPNGDITTLPDLGSIDQLISSATAESLSPRAAARRFAELLDEAARELTPLGLERPATQPGAYRWANAFGRLPSSVDGQLASLLARIALILDALDQALREDGAAVTAGEARGRASRLRRLDGELTDLICAAVAGVRPLIA